MDQGGGLTKVAKTYAQDNDVYDDIYFNTRVKAIDYSDGGGDDGVTLIVETEGNDKCIVKASKVIFTPSAGVIDRSVVLGLGCLSILDFGIISYFRFCSVHTQWSCYV